MAGYIMSLKKPSSKKIDILNPLETCISRGVYSTNMSSPINNKWKTHHESTFSDYATMKEGDNIYFFIDRKIYGIGTLKNINRDCKYNNYTSSSQPITPEYLDIKNELLVDLGEESINNRWICTFEPTPFFFKNGVDMDDVLSSNPSKFRMLRAFYKLSFVKIDDDENKALKDIILKKNEQFLLNNTANEIFKFNNSTHNNIKLKLNENNYTLNVADILSSCNENETLSHEMALEAGILSQLSNKDSHTESIFGNWDYISHQVIASPFKPLDYIDKMDVFGYKYIPGFYGTISKYLLMELKKGDALPIDIDQVMKYVDWISQEYSYGDYSMINAFLVAKKFDSSIIEAKNKFAQRNYIVGRRPPNFDIWTNLTLVEYTFNTSKNLLEFNIID